MNANQLASASNFEVPITREAFDSLSRPIGGIARAAAAMVPVVTAEPVVIPVLLAPATSDRYTDGVTRAATNSGLIGVLSQMPLSGVSYKNTSVALSIVLAAFPKFMTAVGDGQQNIVLKKYYLTGADIDNLAEEDEGLVDLSQPGLTDWVGARPSVEYYKRWELYGMVGILLYSLGKSVNPNNFSQLTENRPKAIAGLVRGTPTPGGFLTATLFPSVEWVLAFQSGFAMVPSVRSTVVREVVSWIGYQNADVEQKIVSSVCRLWQGSGWKHVELISNLLAAYMPAINEISELRVEAARFIAERHSLVQAAPVDIDFRKVICPEDDILSSRRYEKLFQLAVEVARRANPRLIQYAPGTPPSAYMSDFEERLTRMGRKLPVAAIGQASLL